MQLTLKRLGPWSTVDAVTEWGAEDGSGLVYLQNAFWRICGWTVADGSHSKVFKSADRGATWVQQTDYPGTPRHAMPVIEHYVGGTKYGYVMGSDPAAGAAGDIRRFNGTSWETVCATSPCTGLVSQMAVSHNGRIYILGGQTDNNDASTRTSRVWRAADADGSTYTDLGLAPWNGRGLGTCGSFGGLIVVAAGGANDAVVGNDVYYNDVWTSPDGSAWTQRLADGHSLFTKVKYTSGFVFHDCFWIGNGSGVNRTDVKQMRCTKDFTTWFNCDDFQSSGARHADSWGTDGDCLVHFGGIAANGNTEVHRWDRI